MYKIWIRNKIVNENEAMVNILSPTSQFGLNVFEGIRGYWNENKKDLYIFRLHDHLRRLVQSCRILHIPVPYPTDEMIEYLKETIVANDFHCDCAIRMTIFGDGIGSWHSTENFDMFIAPIRKQRTDIEKISGKTACVSSWQRINDNVLPPRAKVGANYINSRFGYLQAKKDGYDFPIFLDNFGKVSESSGACIFLVKNGTLVTPSLTSSVLESITRDTIITIAKDRGLEIEERVVDRTELYMADEVFLCGTAAEITPIIAIDRYEIGNGKVGDITKSLYKEYLDIVSGATERYPEWRTEIYKV